MPAVAVPLLLLALVCPTEVRWAARGCRMHLLAPPIRNMEEGRGEEELAAGSPVDHALTCPNPADVHICIPL